MSPRLHHALALALLTQPLVSLAEPAPWARLRGRISSNNPLVALGPAQILVMTLPEPTRAVTNSLGSFDIVLPLGSWTLNVSADGFIRTEEKVILEQGLNQGVQLCLEPLEYRGEEIVVRARAFGPSKEIMQALNSPLRPEPTAFEKKIAPTIQVLQIAMIAATISLIALAKLGNSRPQN